MNQLPGTEVVAAANTPAAPSSAKAKKIARVTGAAVFTFAMFGTLALPAYAMNDSAVEEAPAAVAPQTIKVTAGPSVSLVGDIPLEIDSSIAEQLQRERALEEAEQAATELRAKQQEQAQAAAAEVPAGVGAGGIVGAAYAQLGVAQDCTDLVQNSLAAVGLTTRRDQGGYDHGVGSFFGYGANTPYAHGVTQLAPGDILVYGGAHVAIYVGGGQAVHGGWNGFTTAVFSIITSGGAPTHVVRMS